MATGNRALPIEDGEVLPAARDNGEGGDGGSGDGFNRSSVEQVRVRACVTACSVASLPRVSRV